MNFFQIRPELRKCLEHAAWESERKGVEEALVPLYEYLEKNFANTYSVTITTTCIVYAKRYAASNKRLRSGS